MILPAQEIRLLCLGASLVSPFHEREVKNGMSFGLGPAGYDVRIKQSLKLQAGGFVIASTIERFVIPNDILAEVKDKSTLARKGIAVQNTVIEPGWEGWLTLEITNHSNRKIDIESGSPIAQIIFHKLTAPTELAYSGKYQNQSDMPVAAIMEEK